MFLEPDDPDHKWMFDRTKRRCRVRGLKPQIGDDCEGWEKHGPHYPNMPYTVFIGTVIDEEDGCEGWVVIYPKKVYWTSEGGFDWNTPDSDLEIPIKEKYSRARRE